MTAAGLGRAAARPARRSSRSTWAAPPPRPGSSATGSPAVTHDFQVGGKGSFGGARPGTGLPGEDPDRRPRRGRRGRGQHRVGRPRRRAARRPAVGRIAARPRLLRPRRHRADRHRRQPRCSATSNPPASPAGSPSRSTPRPTRSRARSPGRSSIDVIAAARGDPRDRQRQHGRGDPSGDRAARHRPPRLHARRVRRRGADARGAARARCSGSASVAVPFAAGVASAVGLVGADLGVELVQTRIVDLAGADAVEMEAAFAELSAQARAELAEEPGATFIVTRSGRCALPRAGVPPHRAGTGSHARGCRRRTTRYRLPCLYHDTYGISLDHPTQVHNLRVHVTRVVDKLTPRARRDRSRQRVRRRAPASAWWCSRRPGPTRS